MPQIGWLEILIIVVLAILIIGPKDFPHVLKKVGGWIGSLRSYFSEVQKELTKVESEIDKDIDIDTNPIDLYEKKNKDD
tara:strand:- start:369 stop:605 length:237 start_codon:yes stop_codon:yes gene_type:complete